MGRCHTPLLISTSLDPSLKAIDDHNYTKEHWFATAYMDNARRDV